MNIEANPNGEPNPFGPSIPEGTQNPYLGLEGPAGPAVGAPAPPPPPRRSRLSRAAVIGGVAGALALGGAGLAWAAGGHDGGSGSAEFASSSSSGSPAAPSSSSTTLPHGGHGHMGMRGGPFGGPGMAGRFGMGPVVHGQYTVKSGSSYKTVEVQVGTVTAVSSTSITVKSSDNYEHTYAVDAATVVDSQAGGISSVQDGDQVRLAATSQGGKDTAVDIRDLTKIGSSRTHFGFAPTGPNGEGEGAPGTGPRTDSASVEQ